MYLRLIKGGEEWILYIWQEGAKHFFLFKIDISKHIAENVLKIDGNNFLVFSVKSLQK